jgi:hypothetical protein
MTDCKKPGLAFWATVVLVAVAYPLSYGPVGWICERPNCPEWFQEGAVYVYYPLGWLSLFAPQPVLDIWDRYVHIFFVP